MAVNECFIEARKELTHFSNDELRSFVERILDRAAVDKTVKGPEAVRRAIDEIATERELELTSDFQRKLNSQAKKERLENLIREKKATVFQMADRGYKNFTLNLKSAQSTDEKLLYNASLGQFSNDELNYLLDHRNSLSIFQAIDGKGVESEFSKSIANKLVKYRIYRNSLLVESDALPIQNINADRFFKATHNKSQLLNGGLMADNIADMTTKLAASAKSMFTKDRSIALNTWREFIKEHLNLEKTFSETAAIERVSQDAVQVNMTEVDKLLNEIFQNIITDKPYLIKRGTGSQEMFFYWKDNEAFYNYNQRYGRKDLASILISDIRQSARLSGTARIFGENAERTFNQLSKIQQAINPLSGYKSKLAKNVFENLTGNIENNVSPTLANFGASLRALTSMKSLGLVTIKSLPDLANGISFAKRWGGDYWEGVTTYLSGIFNVLTSDERQYIASLFKEQIDHNMGYIARFVDSDNLPQVLNKTSYYFYRANLLSQWDQGQKVSSLLLHGKLLGRLSKKEWQALSAETKLQFSKYNFTEAEWNALRTKNEKDLFTMENVNKLSDEELRKIYAGTPHQNMGLLRNELYRKVYSMFDVAVDNAIMRPSQYWRTFLTGNTSSGTALGEAVRIMAMFKQYPISFLDKVVYQGFKDADGAQAKLGYAIMLAGTITPLGYLSYYLGFLAKGKSLPSWDAMSWQQKVDAATEISIPSAGLISSLFRPYNQGAGLALKYFNTPAIQELGNAWAIPYNLINGDGKKFKKAILKTGAGITPGLTLPFVDPYIKKAMGDKIHLEPGQIQLYGK